MLIGVTLTPGLRWWLVRAGDDGGRLAVWEYRTGPVRVVEIVRLDGAELSASEQIEVRALLAAHEAEPLRIHEREKST